MFLPVNGKTVTFSVFVLVALFAAGRLLPVEFWHFVRNNDLAVWAVGLIALYAICNIAAGLFIWLILEGGSFVVRRFINPEIGREQHETMQGLVVHETIYYKDGSEKHYFHYDPNFVQFSGKN